MDVAAYLRHAWPADLKFYHCPNGEHRDPRTAAKLKAFGVLAGVPDITLHLPNGQVAYIEIKAAGGSLTEAQVDFRDSCRASGQGWAEARSLDEVERIITRWLAAFGRAPQAQIVRRTV